MPFKFVFPYWTILSIIVVGGLCVFVDLWWGVKPVWKGLSWSKLSGSKSYLSKQGVDGFFWVGMMGMDSGQALLVENGEASASDCEVLPEDEELSNKVLVWLPLEESISGVLPSAGSKMVGDFLKLDPFWDECVVEGGVLSLMTSGEGRPMTDRTLVAGFISPGADLGVGVMLTDYLSISEPCLWKRGWLYSSVGDQVLCAYLYGAPPVWGGYPKLAFSLRPKHSMAEDFPVGAHLLTVWFSEHSPMGLYVKEKEGNDPF